MAIWRRSDGRIAIDWTSSGGPFIVLTESQWAALMKSVDL